MTPDRAGNRRWRIRGVCLSAGLGLAGCGAAGLTSGAGGTTGTPTPSSAAAAASPTPSGAVTIAELTTLAEHAAVQDGDPGVRVADAVLTTRQQSVTLVSGAKINANEPVYLVQLLGHFTLTDVSIPQNGTAPTGAALTFDVDVSDGQGVDLGLGRKAADLSKLGPVIVLHL